MHLGKSFNSQWKSTMPNKFPSESGYSGLLGMLFSPCKSFVVLYYIELKIFINHMFHHRGQSLRWCWILDFWNAIIFTRLMSLVIRTTKSRCHICSAFQNVPRCLKEHMYRKEAEDFRFGRNGLSDKVEIPFWYFW